MENDARRGCSTTRIVRKTPSPATSVASIWASEYPPREYSRRTASPNDGSHGSTTRVPGRMPLMDRTSASLSVLRAPSTVTDRTS